MPVSVSVVEMEVEILTFCPSCCGVGANTTISHVTVTGTDGGAGGGLQLTLYTYSARWLTEVSLSLTKSTLGIYQPPTSHTNRNILHSHYVIPNTKYYTPDSPLPPGKWETFLVTTDRRPHHKVEITINIPTNITANTITTTTIITLVSWGRVVIVLMLT